jgi:hypothetical protein
MRLLPENCAIGLGAVPSSLFFRAGHQLALLLSGSRIPAPRGADRKPHGYAVWHDLVGQSIVISAILVLIVAVNFLVEYWPSIPVRLAYAGIGFRMLVSYLLPLEKLFFQSFGGLVAHFWSCVRRLPQAFGFYIIVWWGWGAFLVPEREHFGVLGTH